MGRGAPGEDVGLPGVHGGHGAVSEVLAERVGVDEVRVLDPVQDHVHDLDEGELRGRSSIPTDRDPTRRRPRPELPPSIPDAKPPSTEVKSGVRSKPVNGLEPSTFNLGNTRKSTKSPVVARWWEEGSSSRSCVACKCATVVNTLANSTPLLSHHVHHKRGRVLSARQGLRGARRSRCRIDPPRRRPWRASTVHRRSRRTSVHRSGRDCDH